MLRILEVCVDSFESAISALSGGAGRLELCSALSEGGLTPTPGLLMQIQNNNPRRVPIFCMLRCRVGDFIYTEDEIEAMKEDARVLRQSGANGFVFGALNENEEVDMKKCRDIIKACHPLPVTFHRAFDCCKRQSIDIEVIIDMGFRRILTSGKQMTAQLGVKTIKQLIQQVGDRIVIMPGGGITLENLRFVAENTEALEYHGSFRKVKETGDRNGEENDVKAAVMGGSVRVADEEAIAKAVRILFDL